MRSIRFDAPPPPTTAPPKRNKRPQSAHLPRPVSLQTAPLLSILNPPSSSWETPEPATNPHQLHSTHNAGVVPATAFSNLGSETLMTRPSTAGPSSKKASQNSPLISLQTEEKSHTWALMQDAATPLQSSTATPVHPQLLVSPEQAAEETAAVKKENMHSVNERNKKRVSMMVTKGLTENRVHETERAKVKREMDSTMSRLRGFRRSVEEKNTARRESRHTFSGVDLGKEMEEESSSEEETDSGPKFEHSWTKNRLTLIERERNNIDLKFEGLSDDEDELRGDGIEGDTTGVDDRDYDLRAVPHDRIHPARSVSARRKFDTFTNVLEDKGLQVKDMQQEVVIKEKGKREGFRRSFKKSFDSFRRTTFDSLASFVGAEKEEETADDVRDRRRRESISLKKKLAGPRVAPEDLRYIQKQRAAELMTKTEKEDAERETRRQEARQRRPSTALSASVKHLLEDAVVDADEDPFLRKHGLKQKRKNRRSIDRLKDLGATLQDVFTSVPHKEKKKAEEKKRMEAIVLIKVLVMRRVNVWRRHKAAEMIQRNFRDYVSQMMIDKMRMIVKLNLKEERAKREVEEKIKLSKKKADKEEKVRTRQDAILAAQVIGYVAVKASKAEKLVAIEKGWTDWDDAMIVAVHYKYGWPKEVTMIGMKHYRAEFESKPYKAIYARLKVLKDSDKLENLSQCLDLLTLEETEKYLPGFGTANFFATTDNFKGTKTAHQGYGEKVVDVHGKGVVIKRNKYGDDSDSDEDPEGDGMGYTKMGADGIRKEVMVNYKPQVKIGGVNFEKDKEKKDLLEREQGRGNAD